MPGPGAAQVAVLDDFQGVALDFADWARLDGRASITVFRDHLSDPARIVERLQPFDVVCVMRERTPLPAAVLAQLPRLKLIASTTMRNASIDLPAARDRGILVCGTGRRRWARRCSRGRSSWRCSAICPRNRRRCAAAGGRSPSAAICRAGRWACSAWGGLAARWPTSAGPSACRCSPGARISPPSVRQQHGAELVGKDDLFRRADILTVHLVLSDRSRGSSAGASST